MNIITSSRGYERWLGQHLTLVPADLAQKHMHMSDDIFRFLRATYYRWAQRFPVVCEDLLDAIVVLAIGDLHIENFGTWRDALARLIWGVNDFDEAYPLVYTNDLVRLVTSVRLAAMTGHIRISPKHACEAVLEGYRKGLVNGTQPFVLENRHNKLRRLAVSKLRKPKPFWRKIESLPNATGRLPRTAVAALVASLPDVELEYELKTRRAGEGSLGRQRFVALADYQGGYIAREAKAIAPSANVWALSADPAANQIFYNQIVEAAARCPDPCLQVDDRWIVRRLSPSCSRIELQQLAAARDEHVLLKAMGRETANVHAHNEELAAKILADLDGRPADWLHKASKAMAADVEKDWHIWRSHMRSR